MNPKVFLLIGFLALSLAMMGIATVLPNTLIYQPVRTVLLIFAVFFDVLAFASRYYTYLLAPLVKQRKKDVIINDQPPYWVSSTGDCIVRKDGNLYTATAYINIPLYVSASEMSDEEKFRFSMQVSRLVGISKDPVRFTSELYLMNKDEYIQQLKDNVNAMEMEEANLSDPNSKATAAEKEHVKGKLSMWRHMLESVSKDVSFELGSFATISAKGVKEFEAISIVQQKARELMNGIASTLGVSPNIVVGNDILKYIEPEFLIPYTTITEQISRNIQQQVS